MEALDAPRLALSPEVLPSQLALCSRARMVTTVTPHLGGPPSNQERHHTYEIPLPKKSNPNLLTLVDPPTNSEESQRSTEKATQKPHKGNAIHLFNNRCQRKINKTEGEGAKSCE